MLKRGNNCRKAQLSIFILIAIIVAGIVVGTLYAQGFILPLSQEESRIILGTQVEPARRLVANCVEQTSSRALELLGRQAGYYTTSDLKKIDFAGEKVVVAQRLNGALVNRLPSIAEIEVNFVRFMQQEGYDEIDRCADFGKLELQASKGQKNIAARIKDDSVDIQVDWPITLKKGRARLEVQQQNIKLQTKAGQVIALANDIVNAEAQGQAFQGESIDKYITTTGLNMQDLEFTIQNYPTSQQSIFLLESKPSQVNEKEFKFYFAVDRS